MPILCSWVCFSPPLYPQWLCDRRQRSVTQLSWCSCFLVGSLWADENTEALGCQVACLQPCSFSQCNSRWSSSLAAALVRFQCHKLSCGISSTLLTIPGTQCPHLWNGLASVSTCLYLVVTQYEWDDCKMHGTKERFNKGQWLSWAKYCRVFRVSQAGAGCWGGQGPPCCLGGRDGMVTKLPPSPRTKSNLGCSHSPMLPRWAVRTREEGTDSASYPWLFVPSSEPQHQGGSFISRTSIFNKQDHDKVWWPQGPNGLSAGISGAWVISQERALGRLPGAEFTLQFSAFLFSSPPPSSIIESPTSLSSEGQRPR